MSDTNNETYAPFLLVQYKKEISIGLALGLLISVVLLFFVQRVYETKMTLSLTPQIMDNSQSSRMLDLSAVAKFNTIDGTLTLSSRRSGLYKTMIRSPRVAALILKTPDFVEGVAQHKSLGLFGPNKSEFSPDSLSSYLHRHMLIQAVSDAEGLLEISYKHPDPDFAENFLSKLHVLTDEIIRNDFKNLVEGRILFVKRAMEKAINPEHKRGLADLLLQLERQSIMVNADRGFVMQLLSSPSTNRHKSYPNTMAVVFFCMVAGAVLAVLTSQLCRHKR